MYDGGRYLYSQSGVFFFYMCVCTRVCVPSKPITCVNVAVANIIITSVVVACVLHFGISRFDKRRRLRIIQSICCDLTGNVCVMHKRCQDNSNGHDLTDGRLCHDLVTAQSLVFDLLLMN